MKDILAVLHSTEPAKWLFYGDSITMGASHTLGWRDYTQHFAERIRYELRRMDDIVLNTAYDGNTTRHLLDSFDWRVGQFHPRVVFIMIGTNDCCEEDGGFRVPLDEFKSNLNTLVRRIRLLNAALPILQTACPLLPGGAPNRERSFPKYMAAVRVVAREEQVPVIDHLSYWRRKAKLAGSDQHPWMGDAIHPNGMGHRVLAELIFRRLNISPTRSSPDNFS